MLVTDVYHTLELFLTKPAETYMEVECLVPSFTSALPERLDEIGRDARVPRTCIVHHNIDSIKCQLNQSFHAFNYSPRVPSFLVTAWSTAAVSVMSSRTGVTSSLEMASICLCSRAAAKIRMFFSGPSVRARSSAMREPPLLGISQDQWPTCQSRLT